jgi:hypothetical protein
LANGGNQVCTYPLQLGRRFLALGISLTHIRKVAVQERRVLLGERFGFGDAGLQLGHQVVCGWSSATITEALEAHSGLFPNANATSAGNTCAFGAKREVDVTLTGHHVEKLVRNLCTRGALP